MESQPQNPEFRINPENFRPCKKSTVNLTDKVQPNVWSRKNRQSFVAAFITFSMLVMTFVC